MQERWPAYSLFELTSFAEIQTDRQNFYEVSYRMQESPEYCIVAVTERIAAAEAWYGVLRSLRVISWMCEGNVNRHGEANTAMLDTFTVSGKPDDYYTQALVANGVLIKAADKVDPEALSVASDVVKWMLDGRQDITECMPAVGAAIAIIPKDEFVTTLPEFARLKGRGDFTGRTYDSMQLRGLGAVKGQPVSAAAEEGLIEVPTNLFVIVHEFAHAIQNLCFNQADHEEWGAFYAKALEANIYPGTHMMHDVDEFLAVFSSAYFEVTPELGRQRTSRQLIEDTFPEIYESLRKIYGTPEAFPRSVKQWD